MKIEKLVHIVDDEESIRSSIGYSLKTSGYTVETWVSGANFLKHLRHADPGCILLDIRMPHIDGIEVQRILAERGIMMPIVIMTGHGDIATAVRAMRAGAVDFLEKPFEKESLLHAVDLAFDRLNAGANVAARAAEAAIAIAALTPREHDVLERLAQGLPNKIIAYELGVSSRTIEIHRANVMEKLCVKSLASALRIAFAAGMGS